MKGDKKAGFGFYVTIVGTVLAIISVVLFGSVMYRYTPVYYMLGAAIVLGVLAIILPMITGYIAIYALIPLINAVLMASAFVWGTSLMVNQIGYVFSGLDAMSTIMSWIYFTVATVLGMLVNIIASFAPMAKDK